MYKKYTFKNGVRYGPYLYENKRVGEKIITTYIGKYKKKKETSLFYILIFTLLIFFLIFFFYKNLLSTGRIVLNIEDSYINGEKIYGTFKLNLREGELIPRDSKVIINLGKQNKELLLFELLNNDIVSGNYYTINSSLSLNGEGYGLLGEKTIYPAIDFEILISKDKEIREERREAQEEGREQKQEINTESKEEKEETKEETAEIKPDGTKSKTEEIKTETIVETREEKQETKEETAEIKVENKEEIKVDEAKIEKTNEEKSKGVRITGTIISEEERIISGSASKEKEFIYDLKRQQAFLSAKRKVLLKKGKRF